MKTPIKHLEHPEDMVLGGDLSAVLALQESGGYVSLKIDGAPAIVYGTDPNTAAFFVGTKSVFNKKKIKICYLEEHIDKYYSGEKYESLNHILKLCLKYLPRTNKIIQADFIGSGDNNNYKPNTIEYKFRNKVTQKIIIAPHTYYEGDVFSELEPHPLTEEMVSTKDCLFVQPMVDRVVPEHEKLYALKPDMIEFLSGKELAEAKKKINDCIRCGLDVTLDMIIDITQNPRLSAAYIFTKQLKEDFMRECVIYDAPTPYFDGERCSHEGFVYSSEETTFKLVDREEFSMRNMTSGRFS